MPNILPCASSQARQTAQHSQLGPTGLQTLFLVVIDRNHHFLPLVPSTLSISQPELICCCLKPITLLFPVTQSFSVAALSLFLVLSSLGRLIRHLFLCFFFLVLSPPFTQINLLQPSLRCSLWFHLVPSCWVTEVCTDDNTNPRCVSVCHGCPSPHCWCDSTIIPTLPTRKGGERNRKKNREKWRRVDMMRNQWGDPAVSGRNWSLTSD